MMCHVHPHVENTWKLSTHVNNRSGVTVHCVDCHLPPKNNTVSHYMAKASLGIKDVWSFLTKDSADFNWEMKSELEHAVKYIPNASCKECHRDLSPQALRTTELQRIYIMKKMKKNLIYNVSVATWTLDITIRTTSTVK